MIEREHLIPLPNPPVDTEPPASKMTLDERLMASDTLNQCYLSPLEVSLKSMLKHPKDDDRMEHFKDTHTLYTCACAGYVAIAGQYLVEEKGLDNFVGRLPEIITTINNERVDKINEILRKFSKDDTFELIQYDKEEVKDDMQISPIASPLRIVEKDDPYGLKEPMQKAEEVISRQARSESTWLLKKRSELADRPSKLTGVATRIKSLFM